MAIGRTARGTATGSGSDGSGAYQLAASVTVGATGSTLVVTVGYLSGDPLDSLSWNGQALTLAILRADALGNTAHVFVLQNATAGTGAVVVDDTNSGGISQWIMTATEVTSALAASLDMTHGADGLGTAPSSGNTSTTSQANEMLLGFIVRVSAVVGGTWSGSFTAGQNGTSGAYSLEEGYRSVTATGTYAAAKTGTTTAAWVAVIITLKEGLAPTSATIGMGVTATLPQPGRATARTIGMSASATLSEGGRRDTLRVGASVTATLQQPGRAGSLALSSMGVTAEMDSPVLSTTMLYPPPGIAAPIVTLTAAQMQAAGSVGVRTSGAPYIAAWMDSTAPFNAIVGGGEIALRAVMALYEAPHQLNSPTEPHYLVSIHKINGYELYSIGVTPDLRLCAWTGTGGLIYSAPGLVPIDGSFHQYELATVGLATLSMDGVAVSTMTGPGVSTLASDGPLRVMAFNGVAGTTRCSAAIMRIEISTENNPWAWAFSEGYGSQVAGGELGDDLAGVDWTLRFGWYDPRPTYPLSYGAPPTGSPGLGYRWLIQTQYRKANVVRPNYRRVTGGSSGGFRDSQGVQST